MLCVFCLFVVIVSLMKFLLCIVGENSIFWLKLKSVVVLILVNWCSFGVVVVICDSVLLVILVWV